MFVHNLHKFFSNGATVETTGESFGKLKLAVEYNGSAPPTKGEATAIHKRLPNLSNVLSKNQRQIGIVAYKSLDNAEKTLNQQLQNDRKLTETLKRFENILYGPHSDAFCQIMDIFVSGYWKLDIDKDVLCVRLIFEEKIKFWEEFISSNHAGSVRASYKAQIISFQHLISFQHTIFNTHLYNFNFTKMIMSKINTK